VARQTGTAGAPQDNAGTGKAIGKELHNCFGITRGARKGNILFFVKFGLDQV
jgi:hypothetical protein